MFGYWCSQVTLKFDPPLTVEGKALMALVLVSIKSSTHCQLLFTMGAATPSIMARQFKNISFPKLASGRIPVTDEGASMIHSAELL